MRIGDKPLSELTDAELQEELQRRRRRRGYSPERSSARAAPGWKVRQWYRNLELKPGASRAEVEEAYERLSQKYDPDRYDDEDKRRAAIKLVAGLGEAYYGLLDHFDRG
jgi:DnaJ-domain-containing protein 1